jgi:hypothetical protein
MQKGSLIRSSRRQGLMFGSTAGGRQPQGSDLKVAICRESISTDKPACRD